MTAPEQPGAVELQITCGDPAEAERIAGVLVERRLAACVQQTTTRSTYRWDGELQHDDEVLLLAKTTPDRVEAATAAVLALHSYDVPAVTVVPIVGGSDDYLAWVVAETR